MRDGRDVRTNQVVPRAVVTAELFEAVLSSVEAGARPDVAARLEIDHPRQAFDQRCFEVGRLVRGTAWGFDRGDLVGAEARRLQAHRTGRPSSRRHSGRSYPTWSTWPTCTGSSTIPPGPSSPSASRSRIPRVEDEIPTVLPLGIGGLDGWRVGTRLLEARLAGYTVRPVAPARAVRSARFPRAPWAPPPSGDWRRRSRLWSARPSRWGMRPGPGEPMPVDAELPDGTRVVGSVQLRLPAASPGPVRLYYSRAKATHRVAAWLDLMALWPPTPVPGGGPSPSAGPEKGNGGAAVTDLVAVRRHRRRGHERRRGPGRRRGLLPPRDDRADPAVPDLLLPPVPGQDRRSAAGGAHEVPEDGDHPAVQAGLR